MKKFLAIAVIAAFLVACNNDAEKKEEKKIDSTAEVKKDVIDSTAEQKKAVIDSIAEAKKRFFKEVNLKSGSSDCMYPV